METLTEPRIMRPVSSRPRPPVRSGPAVRAAALLTSVVAAVVVVESLLGLLVSDLYPEQEWAVAALRGNDLVTLTLVAPVLVVAPRLARRQASTTWLLLWVAALLYNTYNFAYYVFGTAFNDVFLLHVASFSGSLIALVLVAASLDVAVVSRGVPWGRATRLVGAFMLLVGAALVVAWGGLSLRFAITGELPASFMPADAVHLVYALDLAVLAPSFLLGGSLLRREEAWGYVVGVAVNAFGAAYLVVLWMVGGFQANAGIGDTTWLSAPAVGGAVLCAAATGTLLRIRQRT